MTAPRIAIVGAGPVGMICALGLARAGINCVVIERESGIVESPRAITHHWSTLPGLDELGILDTAIARGFRKNDFALKVRKTGEDIRWTLDVLQGHVTFPFNLYLPQHTLAEVILDALTACPEAEIRWDTTVTGLVQTDSNVTLTLNNQAEGDHDLTVDWVIGADGARSTVRRAAGLEFEGFTWERQFIATNIDIDLERHGYARSLLLVDDTYGAVLAKIDTGTLWRVAFAENADLPDQDVISRIHATLPKIVPEVAQGYELVHHSIYRMHQRAASRFRAGRVVLAGDAAHATNPSGGFGLATGFLDAFVLYEALAAILHGKADPAILDAYADARRRVFTEYTSPQATRLKKLVFREENLDEGLERFRLMARDEKARLQYSLFAGNLETPSLVMGRRFNPVIAA